MKKKLYIEPSMKVVIVAPRKVLCGSITQSGDRISTTLDDESFGDDETINARRFSW